MVENITLDVKELIHSLEKRNLSYIKLRLWVISGQLKANGSDARSEMRVCIKEGILRWKWVRTSWRECTKIKQQKKRSQLMKRFSTQLRTYNFYTSWSLFKSGGEIQQVNNCGIYLAPSEASLYSNNVSPWTLYLVRPWICKMSLLHFSQKHIPTVYRLGSPHGSSFKVEILIMVYELSIFRETHIEPTVLHMNFEISRRGDAGKPSDNASQMHYKGFGLTAEHLKFQGKKVNPSSH